MKILLISDFFPDPNIPGGASTRVYHLMRELARRHSITLLTTKWLGIKIDEARGREVCEEILYYEFTSKVTRSPGHQVTSLGIRERIRELKHLIFEAPQMVQSIKRHDRAFREALGKLRIEDYDLIQVEDSYIAYRIFDIKKRYPHIPIVVDLHNVNALMEKRNFEHAKGWRWRLYCYLEWKKMARYEAKVFRAFDLNLTCSEEDKKIAQKMAPNAKFSVIPNGVDTSFFMEPTAHSPQPNALFFLGSNWTPNVDGILYFHKYIYPNIKNKIPTVKLYIIGNFKGNEQIEALADENTALTGYVKDVREWMAKGVVSIVPLRMGGGTRLKILEAMSMGKAIVSTSMGAEGIEAANGENIIIADDPQGFADAVVRLLRNNEECLRLGRNARKLAKEKYGWEAIGAALNSAYISLRNTPKARILYLLDIFPATSETFILNEMLEMERQGYEISIFARKKEDGVPHGLTDKLKAKVTYLPEAHGISGRKLIKANIKMLALHPANYAAAFLFALKRKKDGLLWFFKIACYYADIVKGHRFEHIHAHFASLASCYAMLIGKILGKPYTFTVHGWHDLYGAPPKDLRERALCAKKLITISEYNKKHLIDKFNIPAEQIEVVHCGVDLTYFRNTQYAQRNTPNNVILSVARLHPVKGLDTLMNACVILKKKMADFRCFVIGDGEQKGYLNGMISNVGLDDKVSLLGKKRLEELRGFYETASVFVLPSKHETMGVATMEAMACGVPVVSTNIYGIPELVEHDINGFLISPGDDKGLARYLEELLSDGPKRDRMGKMGRKKIEEDFNLQKEVSKLASIWFEND